jgi:hypothetical protein
MQPQRGWPSERVALWTRQVIKKNPRPLGLWKESHVPPDMKPRNQKAKQPLHRAPKKTSSLLLFRLAEFSPKGLPVALCFAYLLSWALIVAAAVGDLWLDEIWSIEIVRAASGPMEIFTRFHHDNNHVLNTLFLWLVGAQNTLFLYRLFAVVSGMVALLLVGYLARDWGFAEALLGVVLTGTSYPLVLYFSEARGYAPAIMFALISCALLRRNWVRVQSLQDDRILDGFYSGDPFASELRYSKHGASAL